MVPRANLAIWDEVATREGLTTLPFPFTPVLNNLVFTQAHKTGVFTVWMDMGNWRAVDRLMKLAYII